MTWWTNSDNLIPSILAVSGSIIVTLLTIRASTFLKNKDIAAVGLSSLVSGWKEFTDDLKEQLRSANEICERRIKGVEDEMERRDNACKIRIAEIELQLTNFRTRKE